MSYNQLITQVYFNVKKELEYLFPEISIAEYMFLHIIAHIDDTKKEKKGQVYLKELAAAMEMSMVQASHLAQAMSEKGLVEWTHDPSDASEGTYLKISSTGKNLLHEQELHLMDTFQYIRGEISSEELFSALQTIFKIRNVLTKKKAREEN